MKDLSLLTWKEIKALDKDKSIVSVVLAPIEEHGWHLSLATDLLEGEHWSRGALARAEEELGAGCYYLPVFPVAAASVNEFYGSIHFSMKTTYAVQRMPLPRKYWKACAAWDFSTSSSLRPMRIRSTRLLLRKPSGRSTGNTASGSSPPWDLSLWAPVSKSRRN